MSKFYDRYSALVEAFGIEEVENKDNEEEQENIKEELQDIFYKKKIVVLKNIDKGFHEKWTKRRGIMDIPHPYQMLIFGIVNSGKTNNIVNLVGRNLAYSKKPFQRIYVIHNDPNTEEYTNIQKMIEGTSKIKKSFQIINYIPVAKDFDKKVKNLLIIDDLSIKKLKPKDRANLNRLFGSVSTHNNLSVILSSQNVVDVPVDIFRLSNFFITSKIYDQVQLRTLESRLGISNFAEIQSKYLKNIHDFLWIDRTKNSPYPVRLNGYTKLKILL